MTVGIHASCPGPIRGKVRTEPLPRRTMPKNQKPLSSVDSLIQAANRRWVPPSTVEEAMLKIVSHNKANPKNRLGGRKVSDWLKENGVTAGKGVVCRWLLEQEKGR